MVCITVGLAAKEKAVPTVIKAWTLDTWTGVADTLTGKSSFCMY